jgi:hypothetical protein
MVCFCQIRSHVRHSRNWGGYISKGSPDKTAATVIGIPAPVDTAKGIATGISNAHAPHEEPIK